jgi:hypothetical protein
MLCSGKLVAGLWTMLGSRLETAVDLGTSVDDGDEH